MSTSNPTRVSAGTPDGGRFAVGKRAEDPSVTLESAEPQRKPLRTVLNGMNDGDSTDLELPDGAKCQISYREYPAIGDNGQRVRGDKTGSYMIDVDGTYAGSVEVGPHGTSGYGNSRAKSYGAEQVEDSIARITARHPQKAVNR